MAGWGKFVHRHHQYRYFLKPSVPMHGASRALRLKIGELPSTAFCLSRGGRARSHFACAWPKMSTTGSHRTAHRRYRFPGHPRVLLVCGCPKQLYVDRFRALFAQGPRVLFVAGKRSTGEFCVEPTRFSSSWMPDHLKPITTF